MSTVADVMLGDLEKALEYCNDNKPDRAKRFIRAAIRDLEEIISECKEEERKRWEHAIKGFRDL